MYYYEHNIGDYRKDTAHLSIIEHGVYRLLLDYYYMSEQAIPLDYAKVMRSLCVRSAEEKQAFENVLQDFFERTEIGYLHKRCELELDAYRKRSKSASDSAKVRWQKVKAEKLSQNDAPDVQPQIERNANASDDHANASKNDANHLTNKPSNQQTNNQKDIGAQAPSADADQQSEKVTKIILSDKEVASRYPDVDKVVMQTFLAVRKKKKATNSVLALETIEREAKKAGITIEAAFRFSIDRDWKGFEAAWYHNWITKNGAAKSNYHDFDNRDYMAGLTENEGYEGEYRF